MIFAMGKPQKPSPISLGAEHSLWGGWMRTVNKRFARFVVTLGDCGGVKSQLNSKRDDELSKIVPGAVSALPLI